MYTHYIYKNITLFAVITASLLFFTSVVLSDGIPSPDEITIDVIGSNQPNKQSSKPNKLPADTDFLSQQSNSDSHNPPTHHKGKSQQELYPRN